MSAPAVVLVAPSFTALLSTGYTIGATGPQPATGTATLAEKVTWGIGSTENNAQFEAIETLTIVSGTPQTVDLTAMTDAGGNAVTFNDIAAIVIVNTGTTTGANISISGTHPAVAGTFIPVLTPGGGTFAVADPTSSLGVVSGTSNQITLTCASGSTTVTVAVIGR